MTPVESSDTAKTDVHETTLVQKTQNLYKTHTHKLWPRYGTNGCYCKYFTVPDLPIL